MVTPSTLQRVLSCHFDRGGGAPYWIEKAKSYDFSPQSDIKDLSELACFGPMDIQALRTRPVEDFIPIRYQKQRQNWILGETGGTSGIPIVTIYQKNEFHEAFVRPFQVVAEFRNFPKGKNWLWIGPSGPHIIGKAARECAKIMDSPDPFAIDFDPRWAKKFAPDTLGFIRYMDHIIEQAMQLISRQRIEVLFTTPVVLANLMDIMTIPQRERITGIHFGGMSLTLESFEKISSGFPNAIMISGYGNALFGMCPEFMGQVDNPLDFFPIGDRLYFQTVSLDPSMSEREKLMNPCKTSETGQIVFSRLDPGFLILNLFERDKGEKIFPPHFRLSGIDLDFGIRNPRPLIEKTDEISTGIY